MKTLATILLALASCGVAALSADSGGAVFNYDFESGSEVGKYPELLFKDVEAAVVAPGASGSGHALRFRNLTPGRYAQVTIKRPFPLQKNLVLSFDHREEIEAGGEASYLGVLFYDTAGKSWFSSDDFGPKWRHTEIVLGEMRSSNGGVLALGKVLERISLYGRAKGDT